MTQQYKNKLIGPQQRAQYLSQFILPPEHMDMDKMESQSTLTQTIMVTLANFDNDAYSSKTITVDYFDRPAKKGCVFRTILLKYGYIVHIELQYQNGVWLWWMINTNPTEKIREFTEENHILTWLILNSNETLKKAHLEQFVNDTNFKREKINLGQSDSSCKHDLIMLYALYVDTNKWVNNSKTVNFGINARITRGFSSLKIDTGCNYASYIRAALSDYIDKRNIDSEEG